MKFCTTTCRPCPDPIPGKGLGESRCEQNGVCQLVSMDALPKLRATAGDDGAINLQVVPATTGEGEGK